MKKVHTDEQIVGIMRGYEASGQTKADSGKLIKRIKELALKHPRFEYWPAFPLTSNRKL